jgi:hypothetical protein
MAAPLAPARGMAAGRDPPSPARPPARSRRPGTQDRTGLLHGGLPPPIPPGLLHGGLPPPIPAGPGPAPSLGRDPARRPATSRYCARPGRIVRIPPPKPVPDLGLLGLRPARNPCSWGHGRTVPGLLASLVLLRDRRPATSRCGGTRGRTAPVPAPSPGPGTPLPPATILWCRRPERAVLGRQPSPVPARPARRRYSSDPGRTVHGRPSPVPERALRPARSPCSRRPGRTPPTPAGPARTDLARTDLARIGFGRTAPDPPALRMGRSWAGRADCTRLARTRLGQRPGVPIRTTPGQARAAADRTGPAAAVRARSDRKRRTGHGRMASVLPSRPHPAGRRSATAARAARSRVPARPPLRPLAPRPPDPGSPIPPTPAGSPAAAKAPAPTATAARGRTAHHPARTRVPPGQAASAAAG